MTIEEAISIVSGTAEGAVDEFMYDEALKVLLSSAEKQIPKKAKRGGIYGPSCPSCYKAITEEYLGPYLMHCPFCGQKIDWSRDE